MSRRLDFFTDLCWAEQKPILELFEAVQEKHGETLHRLFGCGFKFCTDCYTCGINHRDIDFLEIDFPFSPEAKEWRAMLAIWHDYYDYLADNDLEEYGEATANDPMEAVCLLLNKLIEVMPEEDKDVFRQAKAMLESRYQHTLKVEAESEAYMAEHPEIAWKIKEVEAGRHDVRLAGCAPEMSDELEKTASFIKSTAEWLEKRMGNIAIVAAMFYNADKIEKLLAKARGELQ